MSYTPFAYFIDSCLLCAYYSFVYGFFATCVYRFSAIVNTHSLCVEHRPSEFSVNPI